MQEQLKLSVLITTCNLEDFIGRALDGVFGQRHAYPYEIVIADDASTDRTRDLLNTYQRRYPNVIRLVFHSAKVGLSKNYLSALEACRGEYVAMLDGDDYWTDPDKLTKQIEFLDRHPDYVLSCHQFRKYILRENRLDEGVYPKMPPDSPSGFILNPNVFIFWATQTLSVVLRRSAVDLNELKRYPSFKDTHLFFCLLQRGKGYAHGFVGGVYMVRGDGHWGIQDELQRWRTDLAAITELQTVYPDSHHLKRARAVYRSAIWDREYKQLDQQERTLHRRLMLKLKMTLFNPYRKGAVRLSQAEVPAE